jgi:uncharacterized protein HemX
MSTPPTPPSQPPTPPDPYQNLAQGQGQPAAARDAGRRKEHRWLWVLTALLLVLAVIVGVIASENQEAKRTAQEVQAAAQTAAGERDTEHNTVNLELNVQQEPAASTAPEETKESATTKEEGSRVEAPARTDNTQTNATP